MPLRLLGLAGSLLAFSGLAACGAETPEVPSDAAGAVTAPNNHVDHDRDDHDKNEPAASAEPSPDGAVKPDAGPAPLVATQVVTAEQASARVMVFDFNVTDWSKAEALVWTWTPPNSGSTFSNLSDVKYSKDGKRLLVAASGGGIAVVQVSNKAILFQATPGGNTHAVEELPDGQVVSASSTGGFLKLFSKTGALVQTIPFEDAHGVYWDTGRKRLYADGGSVVKSFSYAAGALKAAGSWSLPSGQSGAHDLFPIPRSSQLFVSNSGNVYQFDRDTNVFGTYTSGPNRSGIKAVGRNAGSGTVCLLKATNAPGPAPRSWSSDTLIFDQPGQTPATVTRVRPGAQFYKARWVAPAP